MNKKERKQIQLNNHYLSLEKLALLCGVENPNGKKLSVKLLVLEKVAEKCALAYCNGKSNVTNKPYSTEDFEHDESEIIPVIQKLFNNNLKGFFVNGDARGYALKIDSKVMENEYKDLGLQKDWGGYGLLAPEINGN